MHALAIRETPTGHFQRTHDIRFEVTRAVKSTKCFAQVFYNGNIINDTSGQPVDYAPELPLRMLNMSVKVKALGANDCAKSITEWSYAGCFEASRWKNVFLLQLTRLQT